MTCGLDGQSIKIEKEQTKTPFLILKCRAVFFVVVVVFYFNRTSKMLYFHNLLYREFFRFIYAYELSIKFMKHTYLWIGILLHVTSLCSTIDERTAVYFSLNHPQ